VRDLSGVTPEQRQGDSAHAAVTDAPDGTRWVGLRSPVRAAEALLAWGAGRGATRGYLQVGDDDADNIALAASLGFRLHHRRRYLRAIDTV
jgi:hypothetical protein